MRPDSACCTLQESRLQSGGCTRDIPRSPAVFSPVQTLICHLGASSLTHQCAHAFWPALYEQIACAAPHAPALSRLTMEVKPWRWEGAPPAAWPPQRTPHSSASSRGGAGPISPSQYTPASGACSKWAWSSCPALECSLAGVLRCTSHCTRGTCSRQGQFPATVTAREPRTRPESQCLAHLCAGLVQHPCLHPGFFVY